MPQTITMYKGDRSVSNIYPSERESWIAQGWSETPQPIKESEPKPEIVINNAAIDRHAELEAMNWRQLRKIATSLGLEKEEDQAWEDLIPAILEKESGGEI